MEQSQTIRIKTISEFHQLRGLSKPDHPLISIVDYASIKRAADTSEVNWIFDFYQISVKRGIEGTMKYGQQEYAFNFNEGVMFFIAPNQVFKIQVGNHATTERSGWMLLIHPDFFWNTSLAKNIKRYEFFDYSVNEALFLSNKEEKTLNGIIENIRQEYHSNIDQLASRSLFHMLKPYLIILKDFITGSLL